MSGFLAGLFLNFSIYLKNSTSSVEDSVFWNNTYGIYGYYARDGYFNNLTFFNNSAGGFFHTSNHLNFSNLCFCSNKDYGLALNHTWNVNMSNIMLKNSNISYYQFYLINDDTNVSITNVTIINSSNYLYSSSSNLNITFTNLSVGFNKTVGKIVWPYINGTAINISYTNIILEPNFISLNITSNPNLNVSSYGFLEPDECSAIILYKEGFPKTRLDVVENGTAYAGRVLYCKNKVLKFEISGFSGYTSHNLTKCAYLTQENATYKMQSNLYGNKSDGACLTITASNISVEGQGYAIIGNYSGSTFGIFSNSISSLLITNLAIKNYSYGIDIYNSTNINLSLINIYNTSTALLVYPIGSSNVTEFYASKMNISNSTSGIHILNFSTVRLSKINIDNAENYGIEIVFSENVKARDLSISNITKEWSYALYLEHCTNANISLNASNVFYGAGFVDSNGALLNSDISLFNDSGVVINNSANFLISNISISNALFAYKVGIYIINASNISISNSSFYAVDYQVITPQWSNSENISVINNVFRHTNTSWIGAATFYNSNNITIANNAFLDVFYGVHVNSSSFNISKNTFNLTNTSIIVEDAMGNISNNSILNSQTGLQFFNASYSRVFSNNLTNVSSAISLFSSSNNIVFNNFFNFTSTGAYDESGANIWNSSYNCSELSIIGGCLGGNFWANYSGYDIDGDRVGEQPYAIWNGPVYDYLPLTYNTTITSCFEAKLPNKTYNISSNLTGNLSTGICIKVSAENVTIECNGYKIHGNYSNTTGIYSSFSGTVIRNCIIENYSKGIFVDNATVEILNNTILNNTLGLLLSSSNHSVLSSNTYFSNQISLNSNNSHFTNLSNEFLFNQTFFMNISSSNLSFYNLTLAYNETIGKVTFNALNLTDIQLKNNSNIILDPWFISIDNPQFNVSANVTIYTENCNYRPFKSHSFYSSRVEIIKNGFEYQPISWNCVDGTTTFEVSNFSSYTTYLKVYEWWNCSFAYRTRVEVENNGSTSNYVALITLNVSFSHFNNNCSDIRVMSETNESLPFVLTKCDEEGVSLTVDVGKVFGNYTKTIFVYYGNQNASSLSNVSAIQAMEVKHVYFPPQTYAGEWTLNISFEHPFTNPVVILEPDVSHNGTDELMFRIRNLTNEGFEARQQEPSNRDDIHNEGEEAYYIAVDPGIYVSPNNKIIEVWKGYVSEAVNGDGSDAGGSWRTFSFTHSMNNPIIISQIIDFNSTNFVHTREKDVLPNSFSLTLEPEGNQTYSDVNQSLVGWIAFEEDLGKWSGKVYEFNSTPNAVKQAPYQIQFSNIYKTKPAFIGWISTYDGRDSCVIRGQNLSNNSIYVFVQEDTTKDSEVSHTTEVISYAVLEEGIYPLADYNPDISVSTLNEEYLANATLVSPPNNTKVERDRDFEVNCSLIQSCNSSCSNSYEVFLQFWNGTSWDLLGPDSKNLTASLCNTSYNVSLNASIHQYNSSVLVRCLFVSSDDASVGSNYITLRTGTPLINITYPEMYQVVFTGDDLDIRISELEEKFTITHVNVSINGTLHSSTEISQDEWSYIWHIPSSWPEGLVKIEAIAYNSSGNILAKDYIYVYVFKEIACNWWNASWQYKIPVYISDKGIVNIFLPSDFNYSLTNPDGSDIRFVDVNNNEVPYWIEYWEHWKLNKSSIWIKANTSLVYMYFGNPLAQSKSNKSAVFSSPSAFKYIVLSDISTTYGLNITAYENNTEVRSSAWSTTLDSQQTANLAFSNGLKINSTKPISGIVLGNNGDIISPLSWKGSRFAYGFGSRRGSVDRWIVYSFNSTNVKFYGPNGLLRKVNLSSDSVTVEDVNVPNYQGVFIIANDSIVISHRERNNKDSVTLHPVSKELYGISSSRSYVAAFENNTHITVYRSDGTSYSITLNAGQYYSLGGGASEGTGSAIKLVSDKPIGAHQMGDGDGAEETVFLPLQELDRVYAIPSLTQYIAIACPFNNTKIEIYDSGGNLINDAVCTVASTNFPGKAYFGTTSDVVNFYPGTLVVANESIFLYYENIDNGDTRGEETNAISYKQFREDASYSFGKIIEKASDVIVYPFALSNFRECEEKNISVIVGNSGIDSTFNISLIYELNGINYTVDKQEITLSCGENTTMVFNWNHTTGTCGVSNRTVYVFADSDEILNESDEDNNVKSKRVLINYSLIIYPDQRGIELSRNITTLFHRTLQLKDLSYLNVSNVNLTYVEGSPPLPDECVNVSPDRFDEIENFTFKLFNLTINVTCADNGTLYGEIIASANDFAMDHNLTNYSYSFTFSKQEQGFIFSIGAVDFGVVEPNSSKSVELEIFNNDIYDVIDMFYNFSNMEALPLPYIISSSNLTGEDITPIQANISKNATITLNLSNQMPGNYSGTVEMRFKYGDEENSTICINLTTHVLVPWVKDVDNDSVNEHVFDYNNDGNPDIGSFEDSNGVSSVVWEGSIEGNNSFIIDNNGDGEPDVYWDPTFYNDNTGLLTIINKTDANNDTVDEFLVDLNGDGWYDVIFLNGKIFPLPDLNITDIELTPTQLQHENTTTEVNVTVRNDGFNASNFVVGLYANGSLVSSHQVTFLEENHSITVSFNYTPSYKGEINITARVDTTSVIYESNDSWQYGWEKSNNEMSTILLSNASMWHIFYGDINGSILLAMNKTYIFYQWHWNGNGNIYAVSQGSNISWISLTALGKNISGNDSLNDFTELDSLLNTSQFPDNIVRTYSSDGTHANFTEVIRVYGKIVNDVPVTYSAYHFTGILWDSSDSSDDEFDAVDNEDIVFVDKFNASAPYSYHIQVPSTFDTYKGGSVVEFWVELN